MSEQETTGDIAVIIQVDVEVPLIWKLPVCCHFFVVGTLVNSGWQASYHKHGNFLRSLCFCSLVASTFSPSTHIFHHSCGWLIFETHDIQIMESSTAHLNDVCLNGLMTLLLESLCQISHPAYAHTSCCALFTTYNLPMICYNASDANV